MIPESLRAAREAEQALLGAILIESSNGSKDAITAARAIALPSHFTDHGFTDNQNERIYTAMLSCDGAPDQINVARYLFQIGDLRKGDIPHLCNLVAECPDCFQYIEYANAVKEYAEARNGHKHLVARGFQE